MFKQSKAASASGTLRRWAALLAIPTPTCAPYAADGRRAA